MRSTAVPRFYFNLGNGAEFAEDKEGVDLPDFAAAHKLAVRSLRSIMAEDLLMGDLNTASFIEVEDEQHNLIVTVFFDEVVRMREDVRARAARDQGGKPPD